MPYRTKYGSHYHENQGCPAIANRHVEPCKTDGLSPCALCCGGVGSAGAGGPIGTSETAGDEAGVPEVPESTKGLPPCEHADGAEGGRPAARGSLLRRAASLLASALSTGGSAGKSDLPEPPSEGELGARLAAKAVQMMPVPERIKAIPALLDRGGDESLASSMRTLAEASRARSSDELPRRQELAPAMEAGCAIAADLARELSREGISEDRRAEMACALASLTNEGIVNTVMRLSGGMPLGWHSRHSLTAAINQHDMLYAMMALSSPSPNRRFGGTDYERNVVPAMAAVGEWAASGFRTFPRVVRAVERSGGDGTSWHGKVSVLVTESDVDDPHVRELMRRASFVSPLSNATFERGVPGYWKIGASPRDARARYEKEIAALVQNSRNWDEERGRKAMEEWDENMLPILEWLAKEEVQQRLRSAPPADFLDLIE